jgi:hypothetical protein
MVVKYRFEMFVGLKGCVKIDRKKYTRQVEMPRLTKAQIATLSDDDLLQGANDAAKLHQELYEKQYDSDCQKERDILFKQRCNLRNVYRRYEEVLLKRYVDATTTRDPEYLNYYRDLVETKIPPLYKMTL